MGNVMRCSSKIVMDNTHEAKDCGGKSMDYSEGSAGYEYVIHIGFSCMTK